MASNSAIPANAVPNATPMSGYDPSSPVTHELHLPKEAEEWLQTLSPSTFQNYQDIQHTWNHPLTQFSITLVNDAPFTGAVREMVAQHALGRFMGYEALLVVAIWILRAWRLSKASTFLTRLWAQFWVGIVFWVLAVTSVPYLVWGPAYQTAVIQLFKAMFRHFFA